MIHSNPALDIKLTLELVQGCSDVLFLLSCQSEKDMWLSSTHFTTRT